MSQATVYSASQYGLAADTTATGIVAASCTFTGSSQTAELPNHIGCTTGLAVYDPKKEVSIDGIIATKGTGLVGNIGAVVVLANTTTNTRTRLQEGLGVTPNANAAIVLTGNSISPKQSGFEEGGATGVYFPGIATNAPTVLT